MGPARAYDDALIKPEIESYYRLRFEQLCRDALPELYRRDGIETSQAIGECRWGTVRSWPAVVKEVEEKVAAYPNPDGRSIGRWLFTRQEPPKKTRDGVRCVGLDGLYGGAS